MQIKTEHFSICKHDVEIFLRKILGCVCGDRSRYFEPNRDIFPTLHIENWT